MTPELIANYACKVGENPLWNPLDHHVYWIDIPSGRVFRYDPKANTHEVFYQGYTTGGMILQADGSLLLFGVGGHISRLHEGKVTTVVETLPGEEGNRFNDAIADPLGGVLSGTIANEGNRPGSLYRLAPDGTVRTLRTELPFPNGLGFSPDQTLFYHSDSKARTVTQYRYDSTTGDISDPQTFATISSDDGIPDGLTVDAEGFVWVAIWGGSRLVRYDPTGRIEREIPFPVKQVSSLTFGGEDYSDIYVTTAGGENPSGNGELAGALFRLRLGIRGKPDYLSRIHIPE